MQITNINGGLSPWKMPLLTSTSHKSESFAFKESFHFFTLFSKTFLTLSAMPSMSRHSTIQLLLLLLLLLSSSSSSSSSLLLLLLLLTSYFLLAKRSSVDGEYWPKKLIKANYWTIGSISSICRCIVSLKSLPLQRYLHETLFRGRHYSEVYRGRYMRHYTTWCVCRA